MRTRLLAGAAAAAAVVLAGSALAAPSLAVTSVGVSGSTATATGTASFDAVTPAAQVGDTVVTAAPDTSAFAPAGAQLVSASIAPLEADKGLRFIWQLKSLPASPPPEGVRYTWSFGIGDKTYQLQAKRSNVASSTLLDDAPGHVTSAASGAFQLRGNCTPNYMGTPVASCPHLTFLSGVFDSAKAQVRMDVPFGTQGITRGAALVPVQTATMSITAGFQAVVSNTTTSTYINDWATYYTGPAVELATGTVADGPAGPFTPAALTGGTFTGSTTVEAGADVVLARACQATTCTTATAPLR